MEKNEIKNKYELVILVDARLANDEKEAALKSTMNSITKAGGKIINTRMWLEKQRMAFTIKKAKEATYYVLNFEADGEVLKAINADMRLSDKVLRFISKRVDAHQALEALKA